MCIIYDYTIILENVSHTLASYTIYQHSVTLFSFFKENYIKYLCTGIAKHITRNNMLFFIQGAWPLFWRKKIIIISWRKHTDPILLKNDLWQKNKTLIKKKNI